MKYLIFTCLLIAGCKNPYTPEALKEHDAFLKKCSEDCAPRKIDPVQNVMGVWVCECVP